jgi:organic hydroperoxide reductase OsmC/OhrA
MSIIDLGQWLTWHNQFFHLVIFLFIHLPLLKICSQSENANKGRTRIMTNATAEVIWDRNGQDFLDKRYSRRHLWRFDGGVEVPGSSSVGVVPAPLSDPTAVDPEEALMASLGSCHMLWFLAIAARNKFRVDHYRDVLEAVMGKNEAGKVMVATIVMRPQVHFSGDQLPAAAEIREMHEAAHIECYIANSLKTEVRVEPVIVTS